MRVSPGIFVQCAAILVVSAVVGFGVNAVRRDGLPLAEAAPAAVRPAPTRGGVIGVKDAALLYLGGRAVFIDAREPFVYALGHIKGALNLPPIEFAEKYQGLKRRIVGRAAVVAYCDGEKCPLAARLARHLREAGVANVYVLKNGWTLWKAAKLPTERGIPHNTPAPASRGEQCPHCGG